MLEINKEIFTAEEVAEKFGLPYSKIFKAPEFEISKSRTTKKFGSNEIIAPVGTRFDAHIWLPLPNGKKVHLRYYDYMNPELVGDKYIDKYYPAKVAFMGENMLVQDLNIELAIFLYLHPLNEFSPFRSLLREPFHYSFNDQEMKGIAAVAAGRQLSEAIMRAIEYTGEELKTLAKGLGIVGVDAMLDESIQAQLILLAQADPKDFLDRSNSNKTLVRGLIIAGIDNGLFVEDKSHGRHRWIWGRGIKKGVELFEMMNVGATPTADFLIEHIFSRLNDYLPDLRKAHLSISAEQKAEEQFSGMEKLNLSDFFTPASSEFGGSTNEISQHTVETTQKTKSAAEIVSDAKKSIIPPTKPAAKPTAKTVAKKDEPKLPAEAKNYEEALEKFKFVFDSEAGEMAVLGTILETPGSIIITEKELAIIQDRYSELSERLTDEHDDGEPGIDDDDDIPSFLKD